MPTYRIKALTFYIDDGKQNRPVLIGRLPAKQLDEVSEVPSFLKTTGQAEIARNIINPPIEEWQRPLDEKKRTAITEREFSLIRCIHPQVYISPNRAKNPAARSRYSDTSDRRAS